MKRARVARAKGSLPAQILEKVFHPGVKASGFRMRLCRGQRFEFGEEFALPLGETLRRFKRHLDIKIAAVARSQHRHALVFQFELFAGLSAFRDFDLGRGAIERMDADLRAERRLDHRDWNAAEKIGAVALKKRMRLRRHEDVKITRRTALGPCLAFAAETDPRPVLDARRNIDRKAAFAGDPARTAAGLAWIVDDFAAPTAMRTGPFDREEALLRTHPPLPAAGGTKPRFRASLGTGSRASLAGDRGWQANRCRFAVKGLFERNFQVVAEIRPARGALASAAAPPAHHIAEKVVENIRHRRRETIASGSDTAMFEGGMTVAIVSRPFLRIRQRLIGFVQFLELHLGLPIAGIAVGMTLHRRLAESRFHLGVRAPFRDAKNFVIVPSHHRASRSNPYARRSLPLGVPAPPIPLRFM